MRRSRAERAAPAGAVGAGRPAESEQGRQSARYPRLPAPPSQLNAPLGPQFRARSGFQVVVCPVRAGRRCRHVGWFRAISCSGAAVMPQSASARVALYASVGPELTQYDVDLEAAGLVRRGTVTLPANLHYAWPHASGRFLYVASSDSTPGMGPAGDKHHLTAFRIDPASGALTPHGEPIPLPTRPIHMTTDVPSEHLL